MFEDGLQRLQAREMELLLSHFPEFSEADVVTSLCAVRDDQFSYALASGIVGMYKGTERVWRVKVRTDTRICSVATPT